MIEKCHMHMQWQCMRYVGSRSVSERRRDLANRRLIYLGETLVSPASDALRVLPDTTRQQHVARRGVFPIWRRVYHHGIDVTGGLSAVEGEAL
jgi:hypothetical protein